MQLFYHPSVDSSSEFILFSKEESRHIVQVLRKHAGDILMVTDGKGFLYQLEIVEANAKKCQAKIISSQEQPKGWNYQLHVAIAPTKMNDRYEWFLEKATEIGVDEITPIICDHSERTQIKAERFEKVILSAMKQSLKFQLPRLNPPLKFKDFIKNTEAEVKMIAHCADGPKLNLEEAIGKHKKILVVIGPEGDFSPKEIETATFAGFQPLSLGKSRLRTETAGVVACSDISFLKEFCNLSLND